MGSGLLEFPQCLAFSVGKNEDPQSGDSGREGGVLDAEIRPHTEPCTFSCAAAPPPVCCWMLPEPMTACDRERKEERQDVMYR